MKKRNLIKLTAAAISIGVMLCGCNAGKIMNNITGGTQKPSGTSVPENKPPVITAKPTDTASPAVTANGGNSSGTAIPENRGTLLTLEDNGELTVSRLTKTNEAASGDKGVWTVFVYLCGTDLETDQGSGTSDLNEMIEATSGCDKLRFIIETDGTKEWQNNLVKGKTKQRFIIENGNMTELYSGSSTNMGLPSTLVDFLTWGLNEYSSEYMVLDFWNHGGGSITGVCFDENFNKDSLSLKEIDASLASVYEKMTDKFELVGFDACLMSTVEAANILAPYSRYMLASQNLESGYGWDYTAFADAINGGAKSGDALGKSLADAYYKNCFYTYEAADATQAVIDLSKLDQFIIAFDKYAKDAYDYGSVNLAQVTKAAKNAKNFGGNNKTEGYTNMVDIKSLLQSSSFASDSAQNALDALNQCVVYTKNGTNNKDAGGLSVYYPLSVQGSEEIDIFKSICTSPYYLNLMDLRAYGNSTNGDTTSFDFGALIDYFNQFWSEDSFSEDYDYGYWNTEEDDALSFDADESALEYEVKPHIDNEGYYTFKLTEESLYNLDTVCCNIMESFWDDEYGKEYMLDLGTDDYVDFDWNTGVCKDAFDGLWICLPDGQMLCAYLIETNYDGEYSNVYTCPIQLNGEYTNLKIKQTYYENETVTEALGTWSGVDESGAVARDVYPLVNGDEIEPCYPAYDAETFEYECYYYGDPYIYSDTDTFGYDFLEDADYYYSFEINDYYDNTLYTDFVLFGVEDGELYYYE